MELGQIGDVNYAEGDIVVKLHVAKFAKPALEAIKAKVESGEIDPVKGTDLDKAAILKVLDLVLAVL